MIEWRTSSQDRCCCLQVKPTYQPGGYTYCREEGDPKCLSSRRKSHLQTEIIKMQAGKTTKRFFSYRSTSVSGFFFFCTTTHTPDVPVHAPALHIGEHAWKEKDAKQTEGRENEVTLKGVKGGLNGTMKVLLRMYIECTGMNIRYRA